MAWTSNDLISASKMRDMSDHITRAYNLLNPILGDGTELYQTTTNDAGVTGPAVPTTGGGIALTSLPSNVPEEGAILILPSPLSITCVSVVGGGSPDTVTLNGVVFTAHTGTTTPGDNHFQINGGSDTLTAANLAAAINQSVSAGVLGIFSATSTVNVCTISVLPVMDEAPYTCTTSNGTTLALSKAAPSNVGGTREWVSYNAAAAGTITVQKRGDRNTMPSAHPSGAPVLMPCSFAGILLRLFQDLIGDDVSLLGVGTPGYRIIEDMESGFRDGYLGAQAANQLPKSFNSILQALTTNISIKASSVLLGTPSYGTAPATPGQPSVSIFSILDYLRYQNDRLTGTPYGCLVSAEFAKLYWLANGGTALHEKTVFPDRTILANGTAPGGGGTATITPTATQLNRYSANDSTLTTWTQGYCAQRIRARVTNAGGAGGTVAITLTCQGMASDETYFGRTQAGTVTVNQAIAAGHTMTINNVVFTAVNSASPGANQFNTVNGSPTLAQMGTNLVAAINASTTSGILNTISATDDGSGILTLSVVSSTDNNEYVVSISNVGDFLYSSHFGGSGDGGIIGDVDQTLHTFTGTLATDVLNNSIDLLNGTTGDRVLEIITATGTANASCNGAEAYVIETVPDRLI